VDCNEADWCAGREVRVGARGMNAVALVRTWGTLGSHHITMPPSQLARCSTSPRLRSASDLSAYRPRPNHCAVARPARSSSSRDRRINLPHLTPSPLHHSRPPLTFSLLKASRARSHLHSPRHHGQRSQHVILLNVQQRLPQPDEIHATLICGQLLYTRTKLGGGGVAQDDSWQPAPGVEGPAPKNFQCKKHHCKEGDGVSPSGIGGRAIGRRPRSARRATRSMGEKVGRRKDLLVQQLAGSRRKWRKSGRARDAVAKPKIRAQSPEGGEEVRDCGLGITPGGGVSPPQTKHSMPPYPQVQPQPWPRHVSILSGLSPLMTTGSASRPTASARCIPRRVSPVHLEEARVSRVPQILRSPCRAVAVLRSSRSRLIPGDFRRRGTMHCGAWSRPHPATGRTLPRDPRGLWRRTCLPSTRGRGWANRGVVWRQIQGTAGGVRCAAISPGGFGCRDGSIVLFPLSSRNL
jgi:hypothetical protein